MAKLFPASFTLFAFIALVACVAQESAMASAREMEIQVLESRQIGALEVEVIGSPVLCLDAGGNANLGSFTATTRLTNRGASPVTVSYKRGVSNAFQSVSYWPAGQRDKAAAFTECCSDTQSGRMETSILALGEALLISSWTRHHDAIWSAMKSGLGTGVAVPARDYVVRFSLDIAHEAGGTQCVISETFDVGLRAFPTGAN